MATTMKTAAESGRHDGAHDAAAMLLLYRFFPANSALPVAPSVVVAHGDQNPSGIPGLERPGNQGTALAAPGRDFGSKRSSPLEACVTPLLMVHDLQLGDRQAILEALADAQAKIAGYREAMEDATVPGIAAALGRAHGRSPNQDDEIEARDAWSDAEKAASDWIPGYLASNRPAFDDYLSSSFAELPAAERKILVGRLAEAEKKIAAYRESMKQETVQMMTPRMEDDAQWAEAVWTVAAEASHDRAH